ncbi:hypothetical protein AMATHDRAFT_77964 [Amanita thiersii Skay4041]|uniref:PHP domain-like protein n=1 Tax=Amanita thiersii Skay4041 TaxID=703135 RepID=A0A2A9N6I1_9AGAR|nr:hypothetical protein AMATHDRAFT_77964 [Amanita thiersii Skay4041]
MFFDLNVPVPNILQSSTGKAKQQNVQSGATDVTTFSAAQINALDARIDLLIHLGYTVLAFTQTIHKRLDTRFHVNVLNPLLTQLKKRPGILYLKRLNIVLDEDSEKGFGLINANVNFCNGYDLLSLTPTTQATFSLACLTHTQPSQLTTHIISLPLTLPRLNFYLKHTLIRTALRNGAVFEIDYVGSIGGEFASILHDTGYAELGPGAKRNWWASARELVRVTKSRNIIVSSGAVKDADLRAAKDVANLITLLGMTQDAAHNTLTKTPKGVTLRAQTRKTYRAVMSEPKMIIPDGSMELLRAFVAQTTMDKEAMEEDRGDQQPEELSQTVPTVPDESKKRVREDTNAETAPVAGAGQKGPGPEKVAVKGQAPGQQPVTTGPTRKKRKKNNKPLESSVGSEH